MLCGFAAFKAHCTLGFWRHQLLVERGVLPPDSEAWGQFGRLTSAKDLPNDRALTKIVTAAMELNEKGIKPARRPQPPKNRTIETPSFLAAALKKNKKAAAAYEKFPYSHKKEYIEWLTEAKTEETRDRRLAQAIEWMAKGKPRNWKYSEIRSEREVVLGDTVGLAAHSYF